MDVETQIEGFVAKYEPAIAAKIREARRRMRARLPGAAELVYDNYNALAIAYSATGTARGAVFSIAAYPRWVSLFFSQGADLEDPEGRLSGEGASIRHIVLDRPDMLDEPAVMALMDQAIARAEPPIPASPAGATVVKSISAKQRPRRPRP